MVPGNSPWEPDSGCSHLPSFELCPVTLWFELGHGGTPNLSSSTRHLLRLLRYSMSKVPKVPGLGTSCPDSLGKPKFPTEATHTASQTPVQLPGPFPIDPACSAAWESSLSQLLGADKELPRQNPKLSSAPKRISLAADGNLKKLRSLRRQLSCLGSCMHAHWVACMWAHTCNCIG